MDARDRGINEETHLTEAETLNGGTFLMHNNPSGSGPGRKYPGVILPPPPDLLWVLPIWPKPTEIRRKEAVDLPPGVQRRVKKSRGYN